jgi:hypothetical protein
LSAFGAPQQLINVADFSREDMVIQIGVAPRRIDLVTGVSGLRFAEAMRRAVLREIDGIPVKILSAEDFVRNKLASGRPKDLADAALLQQKRSTKR